jgi:hypothetical protein
LQRGGIKEGMSSMASVKKTTAQGWSTVFDMPLDELESRVVQADALMKQAYDLFPGLLVMTDEERKYTNGRVKNGEGPMFLVILSVMEAFPAFFEGLADLDQGVDPTKVETALMRDRIQRAELLARLLGSSDKLGAMADTVLHLRGLVREPIREAYGIAKSMAKTNQKLSSMLAPVLNFYAAIARTAAAARKANAEAQSAGEGGGKG